MVLTMELCQPLQESGFTFQNWYIAGNAGAETKVESSTTVEYAGDHTLTAKWTPITYTFKFHPNDGTGNMDDFVCKYGKKYNLPKNTFARSGYKFVSWNTNAEGTGTEYTNEQLIEDLVEDDGTIINLYAQWSANVYTVTFDPNKGNTSPTSKQVIYGSTYGELPEATKTGYTFNGWYLNGQKIESTTTVTTAEDHTLTAKWTAHTYTVIYKGNGSTSGSTASSTHTYDVEKNLTANGYTRTGHTFKGWNTKEDGTGKSYTDKQSVTNLTPYYRAKVYLYAQWEINKYTVTYDLGDGGYWSGDEVDPENPYDYGSTFNITPKSPTKDGGYYFAGWSTDSHTGAVSYRGQHKSNVVPCY